MMFNLLGWRLSEYEKCESRYAESGYACNLAESDAPNSNPATHHAMSKARNNHYVPRWYQEGFFDVGRNTLAYLDMKPPQTALDDSRVITEKALFHAPTSRAFLQLNLYSTFFGMSINDEIERRLFGDIDARGSIAVRAFAQPDVREWQRHFQTLFEYIDIQKIRTPKGLDWLKAQYPALTQNDLMFEMQGIHMMHCTIWTEGVREIVSAEDADVKFIVSDHPVTIFNHAAPPNTKLCAYPNDPPIALKASQTIFPLNSNFCLILTNLEYARDPTTDPLDKRTFARNYRSSMVRTDAFIRTRKLSSQEVARINYIIKARSRRYIAAGRKEWLYPEERISDPWGKLRMTLLPPKDELWHFGGEMFAKFEDGHVYYQDEFGRTEKPSDFLKNEPCIRERNLMLFNAIVNVLKLDSGKDWISVRRDLTDEQIRTIYLLYEGLWPRETELLQLLPKPDGNARAIYTGSIRPETIADFALGASLYFGELIIEHPFLHAGTVKKEFSPVENPRAYRQEFLKTVLFFLAVFPLVEVGLVNLIPDPCNFDVHLRDQMFYMAKTRSVGMSADWRIEPRIKRLMEEDFKRSLMSLPREALRSQLSEAPFGLDDEKLKERDPLAVLQDGSFVTGENGGQLNLMKLAPNFEMTMYLAQATGSCIITDSVFRWTEIKKAAGKPYPGLATLVRNIEGSEFAFPQNANDIVAFAFGKTFTPYPELIRSIFKYLANLSDRGPKPNREVQLISHFTKTHATVQSLIKKASVPTKEARISCVFPAGGIQDNTVNRLLLMSSSERHLPSVPMAFFIEQSMVN
jgi:hypothetical protein